MPKIEVAFRVEPFTTNTSQLVVDVVVDGKLCGSVQVARGYHADVQAYGEGRLSSEQMREATRRMKRDALATLSRTTLEMSVAEDFSRAPAGVKKTDGPHSGEAFREMLTEALRVSPVNVSLDGTLGFSSSFLKEAFGGLLADFTLVELQERLKVTASDQSLIHEVKSYLNPHRIVGGPDSDGWK